MEVLFGILKMKNFLCNRLHFIGKLECLEKGMNSEETIKRSDSLGGLWNGLKREMW
jgi:hypothetical protein